MVASGRPVVPEVKASRQTSSAAVATLAEGGRLDCHPAEQIVGIGAAVGDDPALVETGGHQIVQVAGVAERQLDLGHLDDLVQLGCEAGAWS